MNSNSPFKWRHFSLSCGECAGTVFTRSATARSEEMMCDRGVEVDHSTLYRWMQKYAPELDKRVRPDLKLTNDSWRVDETYIKVKAEDRYLYRAVDLDGNT